MGKNCVRLHVLFNIDIDNVMCIHMRYHNGWWCWCWWWNRSTFRFIHVDRTIFSMRFYSTIKFAPSKADTKSHGDDGGEQALTRTVLVKITKTIVTKSILNSALQTLHICVVLLSSRGLRNSPVHFKWQQFCRISILEFRLQCTMCMPIWCNGKW